jgi:hypothetical protein
MIGNRTRTQAIFVYPSLQIRFNTQVQNKIYISFAIKIMVVFGTVLEK